MAGFEGSKILITGGASGFGLAIARTLLRQGASVAICDINAAQLNRCKDELSTAHAIFLQLDVTSRESVRAAVSACVAELGGLDGLVNSAGVIQVSPLADISEEDWDHILDVNLKGTFLCCQAAAPHLCKSSHGRIVIIGSDVGKIGFPLISHYTAAKAGVAGLGRGLASELVGSGVTVNTICPVGAPDTGMGQQLLQMKSKQTGLTQEQVRAAAAAGNPMGRNCSADDVVNAVLFLLSADSGFITGQSLDVDGGLVNVRGLPGVPCKT